MGVLYFEPDGSLEAEGHVVPRERRERRGLLCAACAHPITDTKLRFDVQGGHRHTFTNPSGFTYTIGCFSAADGCAQSGIYTAEWTWFHAHEWRYAHCGKCAVHLGWHFRGPELFYGLILDRLAEPH